MSGTAVGTERNSAGSTLAGAGPQEPKNPQPGMPEFSIGNGTGAGGYQGTGGAISRFITPGGHPQDNSQPAFPVFHRKFANPAPLGLMSFGGTTILLSMINMEWRSVKVPNVIVGVALFYGGLCQIITGIMEFASGNNFGTCAFTGYGGFWMSYAVMEIPWFGVIPAYEKADAMNQFYDGLGLWLVMWAIVTFLLTFALLRASIALVSIFAIITLTFFLLAASQFTAARHVNISTHLKKAGGAFGLIGGGLAMYTAMSGLLTADTSYFTIPIGNLAPQ